MQVIVQSCKSSDYLPRKEKKFFRSFAAFTTDDSAENGHLTSTMSMMIWFMVNF